MIVFDLDDTLYLERDFAFSAYRHLDALVQTQTGTSGFGTVCKTLFEAGERRQVFNRACDTLGITADSEFITKLIDAYRAHPPEITLCPDATRFFERTPGPFGLISDGPAHMQRNKVSALGLKRRIPHVRLTGDWPEGFGKPHPRAYEEMEQFADGTARMVYIADNPAKDFVTPNARGWHTIQIERAGGVHDPVAKDAKYAAKQTIKSLDEL